MAERHVVFLHESMTRKTSDKYLLNVAHAYHHLGHKVTLIVAHGNPKEFIEEFEFLDRIDVRYSGQWLPRSLFGCCRAAMSALKAFWMALSFALRPPQPGPALVVTDLDTVAVCVLRLLARQPRLFYYESFRTLRSKREVCLHACVMPSLHQAKFMKMADRILVENALFADIFARSFPALKKPLILYKAIDTEAWQGPDVDIKRIIPDIDEDFVLLLTINKFRRSSNFKLVVEAFETLLRLIDDCKQSRPYHLVVAGNCKTPQEELQYDQVVTWAKKRKCGSQMTILKTLPQIHEKCLIANASLVVSCASADTHADLYLKALCLGKPVVATNRGIATKMIKNRITGVLVEPEANAIAREVMKLIGTPYVKNFMGEVAKDCFKELYSFRSLCNQLRAISFAK